MNRSHDEGRQNSALYSALFCSKRQQTAGSGKGNNESTSASCFSFELDDGEGKKRNTWEGENSG